MPSRRIEQLVNSMTDQEYHEAEESYEIFHPQAGLMSFEEYMEEPGFEEEFEYELEEASRGGNARDSNAFGRSHYVGSRLPYDGPPDPLSSQDRDHHASGSFHSHGDRHDTGRREGYESYSDNGSFAGEPSGIRTEGGRGVPGPPLQSGVSSSRGPGSAAIEGHGYRSGAPPPPSRGGMTLGGRSGTTSSFFETSSHRHGSQPDHRSQGRHDNHGSHRGSTDRHGG